MPSFLHQKKPLILASGSSIRKKLLQSLGVDFLIIPSDCDEDMIKKNHASTDFISLGLTLAKTKALAVSQRYPEHLVIAADQLCVIEQQILDKPMNHSTAIQHLQLLSGKTHQQIACLCIAQHQEILWQHYETAVLSLRNLSLATITAYLQLEQPYHSCGAYQFETLGKWLCREVKGHEDTILGLPLLPLTNALIELGAVTL